MQGNQQTSNRDALQAANWLPFLADAWAVSIVIFLRTGFGARYLGAQGAWALLIMVMFLLFTPPEQDPRPMCCFLGAYLFVWICGRIGAQRRQVTGDATHSFYSGWPRLMTILPFLSESSVKGSVEPVVVAILGFLVGSHNVPLGAYLVAAAVCMLAVTRQEEIELRRRVMDMNDAVSEQKVVAERFREVRGDNF